MNPNSQDETPRDKFMRDGKLLERIDKKDLQPINDPTCKHLFIPDPTDETETYRAMKCKFCPIGILVKKD